MMALLSSMMPSLLLTPMEPNSVPQDVADRFGAKQLNGDPPIYDVRRSASGSTSWVLFLEGGGWCNSPVDCVARMQTPLGSRSSYQMQVPMPGPGGGYFDPPHANNPIAQEFAASTLIHFKYCDGIYASNEPVALPGSPSLLLKYRPSAVGSADCCLCMQVPVLLGRPPPHRWSLV